MEIVTPPHSAATFLYDHTPVVGDNDRTPKVQLCIELRNREIVKSKSKTRSKRSEKVLEVTVMTVKNIPISKDKQLSPFVKLRLLPGNTIATTDQEPEMFGATEVPEPMQNFRFIQKVEFPLESMKNDGNLKGSELSIEVCDKKSTRNAKIFGTAQLVLDHIKFHQPVCKWHSLIIPASPEGKENVDQKGLKAKKKIIKPKSQK